MSLSTCNVFNNFKYQLGLGYYNLSTHVLKFALTNSTPNILTDTVFLPASLHLSPTLADGYVSGGYTATKTWTNTNNIVSLNCLSSVIVTAGVNGLGPFRYVILYDDTPTTPVIDPVIAFWDYGESMTLVDEVFRIDIVTNLFSFS